MARGANEQNFGFIFENASQKMGRNLVGAAILQKNSIIKIYVNA